MRAGATGGELDLVQTPHVLVGEDFEHARHRFRRGEVDRLDAALGDGAGEEIAEGGIVDRKIRAVAGFAGHLEAAVDARLGRPILALGAGAARFMSQLHGGGLAQRPHQRALAELDLECVVGARAGTCERLVGRGIERLVVEPLALEHGLPPRARARAWRRRRRARCARRAPCRSSRSSATAAEAKANS